MGRTSITRREVLTSFVAIAVAGIARVGVSDSTQDERFQNTMLRIARQLFPHNALDDPVYLDVLEPLHARVAADPKILAELESGWDELDTFAGGDWLGADLEIQLAALESIEDSDFFEMVYEAVRVELYYHPVVWNLLGFEGSSVEYGGYIDRGFDNIDWLPKA